MIEIDYGRYVVHCAKAKYDVYVGRPSMWGNPWSHHRYAAAQYKVRTRTEALRLYEEWIMHEPDMLVRVRERLRGKILGCWCAPLPCHGHILARIANQ